MRLPWQRYICRSKYGCFCLSPQVTYLHTKNEGGLKFFISNFASLSWRIALNTSKGDAFIFLPCFAIYNNFSVFKLVVKPVSVLLEDHRSETSCKRNITTTILLYQLRLRLRTFTYELDKKLYIRKPDKCPSPNCTFKIVFCFIADCKDTNKIICLC